ncbi:MICOS complex subunit Mic60 isoform X2 [Condylostylus longicornis]|uniref:MICOS complex subunit Mic60 isoform X2 n=1 Tax=Condylostylus longicornis TaxID=2530218 RepID=UPI00244DA190|nr:MICOS complex subunit Mic60 isoform X2 [Condylostylus longicornis]
MFRVALKQPCKNAIKNTVRTPSTRQYHNHNNRPLEAGLGKVIVILSPVAIVGGIAAYAKYDKEFRKSVEANIPGAESILKILLQEEKPFQSVTQKIESIKSSTANLFGGGETKKVSEVKSSPSATKPKAPEKTDKVSSKEEPKKSFTPVQTKKVSEQIPSDIVEIEKKVELAASLAVKEYNKAINILKTYNEEVQKVVDDAIEKVDLTSWTALRNKTGARDTAVESAENAARDALRQIELYQAALIKHASAMNHEKLDTVRNKIKQYTDHINNVKDELFRTKDAASLSEKYWKKIESARNYYIDEIAAIFPGLNLAEKKLNLSKDDIDIFLMHAYSHVLAYQKELQRLQLDGELRLKRAVEALRGDDQNEAVKSQIDYHLEKERHNFAIENQKKIFKIRSEAEKELRKQLKQQAEAHVDHIKDAVAVKEAELKNSFSRELDEKLSAEKGAYKLQLASMLGKLKGMDAALKEIDEDLKARAESERCAHQAQSLWAACQALWGSVRAGEPGIHWRQKLRPLKSEIKAVEKAAAEGDELVAVVLNNLPKEALERGVYPEDALRERFFNVEKIARKVALVPENGGSLFMYMLSYIQSVLIMRPSESITKEELKNEKFDFHKLDTYEILDRARYFIDRGDLTQTLKYMNLLQGAPRKLSSDWMKEARLLLETQQAANVLMAHAAASGLLYL